MSDTFIEEIVETARKRNGSDLHLRAGRPVLMRTGRLLAPMRETVSSQVMAALLAMIPAEDQEKLAAVGAVTSIIPSLGVRAHFYNESDALRIHLRVLGAEAPRHEKLGRPLHVLNWLDRVGLILVTGPQRVGKSTQIAALVGKILDMGHRSILEIGRPPEFRYAEGESFVARVHVGRDAPSYASAIRESLDGDIDVLVVQQVSDHDSAEAVFEAMEAGHLVIAGMHADDCLHAVDRISGYFPTMVDSARRRLVEATIGITNLRLVMDRNNNNIPATEVLTMNDFVKKKLAEGDMPAVRAYMKTANGESNTLEQDLARLYKSSDYDISRAEIIKLANYPDDIPA